MTLLADSMLGRYRILGLVGAGGMGEVYKAQDTRLDRTVALKVLPRGLASSAEARQRLEREAKAIAALSHPHICALHDVGREGEIEYLVMEYLEGETLAERLSKGALSLAQTLRFGVEIADALDKAHRQGIVHRDLKPGNVMLTKSGVKLLDFGLAKALEPAAPSAATAMPTKAALTQEGTILGTFQYMAPEQLEGKNVDARTDIFALGAVLYEIATGRKAFVGSSQASLISAIMTREPEPISSIQPMTPPALDRVVKTCLAKDPEDRWQSAGDVAKELKWIAEAGSQAGAPAVITARRKNRERLAWAAAATAALGALALAVALVRNPRATALRTWSFLLPPEKTAFEVRGDSCASLTVSPDGRWVTFGAKSADGKVMLWLRALQDPVAHPIAGTEDASFPFWSPDSEHLAFFAGGKLQRVDLKGSPAIAIATAPNGRSGSWNRDGVILFSPDANTEVFRVAASGGPTRPATKLDLAHGETTHRWATFLPDGKHFLYMAGSHAAGTSSEINAIYLASLDSTDKTRILDARSNVFYASGFLFSMSKQILVAQRFDPKRGRLSGDSIPLVDGVQYDVGYFRGTFSVSEAGVLVYATGEGGTSTRLQWYDMDAGKPVGDVFGDQADYSAMSVAPGGNPIAVTIGDPISGRSDLWLMDASGARTRLTIGGSVGSPIYSPDGTRVAYSKYDPHGTTIFIKPTSGGGQEQAVYQTDAQVSANDWSRDGRFLLLDSIKAGSKTKQDIWVLPLFGDRKAFPFLATESSEQGATFSPDGRWVSYISDESGRSELYAVSFPTPGRKLQISPNGSLGGTWLGGDRIAFGSPAGREMVVVHVRTTAEGLEVGASKSFPLPAMAANPSFTADGRRGLFGMQGHGTQATNVAVVTNWSAGLPKE
ncbi:MAG: protein kinase [Acidobacteriota bacterium]|nr:protein kinase [Acidobacteriota bacterium]